MSARSWLLSALGVAALVVFALGGRTPGESAGYQAGEITASVVLPLLIGLALWSAIWATARRGKRPWASAWIVGIAVIVGFLATIPRIADTAERTAQVERLAGEDASEHLRECTEGVLLSYDDATPAEREELPWTREHFSRIGTEYCREVERQGYFEREELPSEAKQQEIMAAVVERMEAAGELPPR